MGLAVRLLFQHVEGAEHHTAAKTPRHSPEQNRAVDGIGPNAHPQETRALNSGKALGSRKAEACKFRRGASLRSANREPAAERRLGTVHQEKEVFFFVQDGKQQIRRVFRFQIKLQKSSSPFPLIVVLIIISFFLFHGNKKAKIPAVNRFA